MRAKCPICRVTILPPMDSPLMVQIRSMLIGTRWEAQLPETTPEKNTRERDPLINGPPHAQPNGPNMISIEIGPRVDYFADKGRRQPDDPKVHAPPRPRRIDEGREVSPGMVVQMKNVLRVVLNCLMLRNVRIFSLGVSPRQTLLIIGIVCLVLFLGFHLIPIELLP